MREVVGKQSPSDAPGAGATAPAPSDQPKTSDQPRKRKKAQKPEPDTPPKEDKVYVLDPLTIFYIRRN
jgi:hypothetical protein